MKTLNQLLALSDAFSYPIERPFATGVGGSLDLPCTPRTISYGCQIVQLYQQKEICYVETHGSHGNQRQS